MTISNNLPIDIVKLADREKVLKKKKIKNNDNWTLCSGCTECCEYISLEIDKPTTLTDVDHIIWYLIHKNVWIWIDYNGGWYVQFNTPCEKLDDAGRCGWYTHRPKICQDYKQSECPRYSDDPAEKHLFKCEDDFINWMKEHKKKKIRSLHLRYMKKRAIRWQKDDNIKNF